MLYVIMGPPCSGKTTHVAAHRKLADVVIDMDALAAAFGGSGPHNARGGHRAASLTARNAILDRLAAGRWDSDGDVWLIHHHPTHQAQARYQAMGAQLVLLDPGEAVCLARARADHRPRWTHTAITEWYADPITTSDQGQRVGTPTPSRTW